MKKIFGGGMVELPPPAPRCVRAESKGGGGAVDVTKENNFHLNHEYAFKNKSKRSVDTDQLQV